MPKNVLIIGGGIAGCSAALKLAGDNYTVTLIESRSELLAGSSDDTPARLGLGFHYIKGGATYLRASVDFMRQNRHLHDIRIAENKGLNNPLRRGRYFIVVDSLFQAGEILTAYHGLQTEYQRLVDEDERNRVFGNPEDFIKILPIDKYKAHVNASRVVVGIETAEHILNWPYFKNYMIKSVVEHKNITVCTNTEVTAVSRAANGVFHVTGTNKESKSEVIFKSQFVVNSSWYNIEAINRKAGFIPFTPEQIEREKHTHRVKALVHIELPEILRDANSMFFCFGPHCSLTNIGDGTGWLTFEPVTNIEENRGITLSKRSKRIVEKGLKPKEARKIGQDIIRGASAYIPSLVDAKFAGDPSKAVKVGVVRTQASGADISNRNSPIHERHKLDVSIESFGWINNPAMKLLYGSKNAEVVSKLIKNHSAVLALSKKVTTEMKEISKKKILKRVIARQIQENLAANTDPSQDSELSLPKPGKREDSVIVQGAIQAKYKALEAITFFKVSENKASVDKSSNLLPSLIAEQQRMFRPKSLLQHEGDDSKITPTSSPTSPGMRQSVKKR